MTAHCYWQALVHLAQFRSPTGPGLCQSWPTSPQRWPKEAFVAFFAVRMPGGWSGWLCRSDCGDLNGLMTCGGKWCISVPHGPLVPLLLCSVPFPICCASCACVSLCALPRISSFRPDVPLRGGAHKHQCVGGLRLCRRARPPRKAGRPTIFFSHLQAPVGSAARGVAKVMLDRLCDSIAGGMWVVWLDAVGARFMAYPASLCTSRGWGGAQVAGNTGD